MIGSLSICQISSEQFNKTAGQKQHATMAYRPQVNGTAECIVWTLPRSIKMYVADVDQKDWDKYAERLTFAVNTEKVGCAEIHRFILSTVGIREKHWKRLSL